MTEKRMALIELVEKRADGDLVREMLLEPVAQRSFDPVDRMKAEDHLPLYRQAEILRRQGVDIDRASLGNWVGRACFHLKPLIDQMRAHLVGMARLFMDETPLPVLDPGRRETKKGYFWTMAADGLGAVGVSRRTRPVDGCERTTPEARPWRSGAARRGVPLCPQPRGHPSRALPRGLLRALPAMRRL